MSSVWLVGITKSNVEGIQEINELLAHIARVSNPQNQMNSETAPKLLKYLVKNKHWSPFEMAHMTVGIDTTRDIARQILRHRSFSFQEFSQRYADPNDLGFEFREARLQDHKNRQASIDVEDLDLQNKWLNVQREVRVATQQAYRWAIDNGIAKEQARAVMPEGLCKSRLYMAGSIRSWIHFILVRCDVSTQKEHREIANKCKDILLAQIPSLELLLNDT